MHEARAIAARAPVPTARNPRLVRLAYWISECISVLFSSAGPQPRLVGWSFLRERRKSYVAESAECDALVAHEGHGIYDLTPDADDEVQMASR